VNIESTIMSGGEALVAALRAEGISVMFGIPGTHNLPVYRHLSASGIRHVTPRHEQGGGYAADGYARVSGQPGIIQATTGPGILNAITPLATAWADSIPVVAISPSLPTGVEGHDTGYLHETKDQHGAVACVVAGSYRPLSPQDVYSNVREAIVMSRSGRPRPRYIGVPLDVLDAVGHVRQRECMPATEIAIDPAALEQAAALLDSARRPAIVTGGGARLAAAEVRALAEHLGSGVLTTVNGKGVLDEHHPLSLGASLRLDAAKEWLSDADVVLAIGTELGESDTWQPRLDLPGKVIRIDVDADQLHRNVPGTVVIQADAQHAIADLLLGLRTQVRKRPDLSGVRTRIDSESRVDGAAFVPLCSALTDVLGEEGILAADSTMATYFGVVHLLHLTSPGRLLYPTGYATLGYALPAGIGAKIARPDLPIVVLSGDGGLMFTLAEIATAVELQLSLPIVVVRNGGYGEIRRQMVASGIDPVGVDLHTPDLRSLAAAFGAHALVAADRSQLVGAIRSAFERNQPTIIEIPQDLGNT